MLPPDLEGLESLHLVLGKLTIPQPPIWKELLQPLPVKQVIIRCILPDGKIRLNWLFSWFNRGKGTVNTYLWWGIFAQESITGLSGLSGLSSHEW